MFPCHFLYIITSNQPKGQCLEHGEDEFQLISNIIHCYQLINIFSLLSSFIITFLRDYYLMFGLRNKLLTITTRVLEKNIKLTFKVKHSTKF